MPISDWIMTMQKTNEGQSDLIRLLAYGDAGAGKTTLAGTFPHPFFIDADKGLKTLADKAYPYVTLSREDPVFDKVMDILRRIKGKKEPFDTLVVETIVIDSITALSDMIMYESMMRPQGKRASRNPNLEKPEFDHWGELRSRMTTIMKYIQDLPVHVVATCGTKLEKDEVRGTFVGKPNIQGSYRDLIGYDFDEEYYLEAIGGGEKVKYKAFTKRYQYYEAKSRMKPSLPAMIEDPCFEKIFRGGTGGA